MDSAEPHGKNKVCLMPRPSAPTTEECHDHKMLNLRASPVGAKCPAYLEQCHTTFHLLLNEALHPSFY